MKQIRKEIKLSLRVDNMMIYLENPREYIRKLTEITNSFSKCAIYKISPYRLPVFLYITNKIHQE